tara:strand:- start:228 stop:1016 length:789 start_codon:yes stop_codon:yes gene_type:complete
MKKNILVLFAGTGSIEKVFDKTKYNVRGLDIDNHFKNYYHQDILTWKYKEEFKTFIPDYIHGSPVCKEFSNLKNGKKRDLKLGYSLIDKTIEIIEYVKTINPKLKFTIENPKKKFTLEYEPLMKYKRKITSYCMYNFLYQKNTIFFYGGFDLKLKDRCNKKNTCFSKSINNNIHILGKGQIGDNQYYKYLREIIKDNPNSNTNIHKVLMGYKPKNPIQMIDWKYYTYLRKNEDYKGIVMSDTFFRYRIPPLLCEDIKKSLDL